MKDKFNHIERRGLPGGPNEQFTYVTGVFSTDGYRYDSPDVNNIYNVIPSGNISMREKNGEPLKKGPILGIDNLGNRELMQPGFDYQFPGDQVFELPMAQIGRETKKNIPIKKKFEQRLNNPTLSLKNKDGTYSTHEMMSFESDGKYYAAPTIIERNGKLERLSKDDAYNYAMQNKEYKEFKTEKEARAYAQGNYKMGTPLQEKGQLHTYDLDEHVVRAIKLPNVDEDDANWQKQQLKKLKAETQKNKESFDRFSNNFQIGTDLASFVPPLAPYAYAVSVPFTLNDMYSDIVKGDYEQLGKDAIGLIPSFKVAPRVGLKGNYVPKTNKYRTNIINGAFNTANLSVDLDKKALGGLLMAQIGKETKKNTPIYVDDKNDPRYKAYNDSLKVYNDYTRLNKKANGNYTGEDFYIKKDIFPKNPDGTICYECIKKEAKSKNLIGSTFNTNLLGTDKDKQLVNSNIKPKGYINYLENNLIFDVSKTKIIDYSNAKPVQPVVLNQKQVPHSKNIGKDDITNEYAKKYPPIYVTDKNDPRIGYYAENGNQYLYKEKTLKKIDPKIVEKQKLIGVKPDGIWGEKSEAAWQEYNKPKEVIPVKDIPAKVETPKQVLGRINVQGRSIPYHSKEEKEYYFKLFQDNGIKVEGNNGNYGVSRSNEVTSGWNGNKLYLKGNKVILDLDLQQYALGGKIDPPKPNPYSHVKPILSDFNYGQTASESTSRTYNSRELKKPVTTATPSVSKQQVAKSVQEAQQLRKIQEDERRARIADAEAAKKTPYTLQNFPEILARETQAIGDKLQSDYIPDILNPAMMLGDFASGLGRVPLNLQQGNYGEAALDIAMPLGIGALAGLGAKTTGQFVNNLVNPLAGIGSKSKPLSGSPNVLSSVDDVGRSLDLEELRRVYHNSERFLQPEELRFLHKHGHGLRENYRTQNSIWNRQNNLTDNELNSLSDIVQHNNQLPVPPSEIQFMPDGTTRTIYNQQQPISDISNYGGWGTDQWDATVHNTFDLNKLRKPVNKSGLTKEEAIAKASAKDKDAISKMSEQEFQETVLKPTGEIVPYHQGSLEQQFTGKNNVFALSPQQYSDEFNARLDLLNDIIAKNNKSGVEYRVKELTPDGRLTFYTPEQTIPNANRPVPQHYLDAFNKIDEPDFLYKGYEDKFYFSNMTGSPGFSSKEEAKKWITDIIEKEKGTKIKSGESTWGVRLNPGQWEGNVEDIANTEYLRSIPGLEMSNTTSGVFADNVARKGTGAYESINEYLKKLDLGRVKPGFNSQTDYSRGAWENFIKSGRGVGFYANPRTVYGTMKSVFPYIGIGALGVGALQETPEYKTGGDIDIPSWLNPYNWGVKEYKGSFSDAYATARKAGEKEFMWNGKRKSTDMKGEDRPESSFNLSRQQRSKIYNAVNPLGYPTQEIIPAIKRYANNGSFKDDSYKSAFTAARKTPDEDAWAFFMGVPQQQKSISESKYKPSDAKDKNAKYYTLRNAYPNFDRDLFFSANMFFEDENYIEKHKSKNPNTITGLRSRFSPLAHVTFSKGEDEKGNYFSMYDTYDFPLPFQKKIGNPYEIYDRTYYKDYGDGKNKPMYYSDKELSNLNTEKKNFDTLALQKELSNRGVKLPKSTKTDGSFDGILGQETIQALQNYQTANSPLVKQYQNANTKIPNKLPHKDQTDYSEEGMRSILPVLYKQMGGDINQPKYQTGNEIAFDIYKKYINGDYIGTLEEGKAKKTYDRLNRIYYKDAKSSGMSVPNYIMTNVVTL